ncbi:MAG: tetratricopeptide repeat protein [Candidatus Omnitrophota bacterium]
MFFKSKPFYIFILLLLTLLIYANVFRAPFHFDDLSLLLENPQVRSFTDLFSRQEIEPRKHLALVSFAINYHIAPYAPAGYRLVNIFLHFLTAVAVATALLYLFQSPFFQKQKPFPKEFLAFGAAAIFCVHPLQTDSVTYIWQRSEILSGLFYALTLMFYWRARVLTANKRFFIYSAGFFLAGLYAKGSVVTAPVLIGLSEIMFFLDEKKTIRNLGIFLLVIGLMFSGMLILDNVLFEINVRVDWNYFYTQCLVIWKYLQLTFLPFGQSVDHGFVWANSLWEPSVLSGFLGLVGLLAAIVFLSSKYRLICFGALWFFIYLLPTSTVIPLLTPIFEHRLYFSLAGFGLLLADIILRVSKENGRTAFYLLAGIVVILSVLTVLRNQLWRNRNTLMEDAVKKSPTYIRPHFTLGSYYIAQNRFDEAEQMFRKCLGINPHFAEAYNNLGVLVERKGKQKEAVELYERSVEEDSHYVDAYLNLSRYYAKAGRPDLSWNWISRILSVNPDHRVYAAAAHLHLKWGDSETAKKLIQEGLSRHHSSPQIFYVQGLLYFQQGKMEQAVSSLQSASRYAPAWFSPFNDLGVVYFSLGQYELAREALEQAHRLSPRDASIYLNLANVYHELGEYEKAEQYYQTSRHKELLPYLPAHFDGKDLLLLNQGEKEIFAF